MDKSTSVQDVGDSEGVKRFKDVAHQCRCGCRRTTVIAWRSGRTTANQDYILIEKAAEGGGGGGRRRRRRRGGGGGGGGGGDHCIRTRLITRFGKQNYVRSCLASKFHMLLCMMTGEIRAKAQNLLQRKKSVSKILFCGGLKTDNWRKFLKQKGKDVGAKNVCYEGCMFFLSVCNSRR